jgi:hypothetical protein
MKEKIVAILVCMLMLSTVAGAFSVNTSTKSSTSESPNLAYSHDILGEFFTLTTCVYCKYAHRALHYLYQNKTKWDLPFYYMTFVSDVNKHAAQRKDELGVQGTPNVIWDSGYRQDYSATGVEEEMARYNTSIITCGNRNVNDIDLDLNVEWLGAVNIGPEDGETGVPVEQIMNWTISEMNIDVEVTSHETGQYNGRLLVYVTEVNSTFWDDKFGDPYTFALLDYAWDEDISLSGAGSTWDDSVGWDGYDHQTGYGEYFKNITQDNIMVIASIFDADNNEYADETTGFVAGVNTDPKTFTVYFGNTTTPPKVVDNGSAMAWFPKDELLEFNTKYYWKIDVWDNNGDVTHGDLMSFTTRPNNPPNPPGNPHPWNGSTTASIKTNLTWACNDPESDDVVYDVYFGDNPEFNMTKVATNQSETWWNTPTLQFQKKYYWRIVAWDEYRLNTTGNLWHFTTEPNYPPDLAHDLYPEDGATSVPVDVIISWNGSDPNYGDTITYDVYFDDVDNPTQKIHNQTETYYDPYGQQDLTLYKTYYWRIVTWDSQGESSDTGVLEFTTGIPPTDPDITGPDEGKPNTDYDFTFVSTDSENHNLMYHIEWGDEDVEETGYHASGEVVTLSHSWDETGSYTIKAKAINDNNGESGWERHTFIAKKSKSVNLNLSERLLLERFLHVSRILRELLGL